MIFNIIALICSLITFLFSRVMIKYKHGDLILRTLSLVILVYKMVWFIVQNLKGQISVPVEISTISYFMVAIILTFKISKLFNLAAFFGISAGFGFFIFYIIAGFTISSNFTVGQFLISNFSHGYLLLAGKYLFKKHDFSKSNKLSIWVTILGMLVWSLLFYDVKQRGITFIYYLIKPSYLFVFNSLFLNILIMIIFYVLLIALFYLWTRLFYKLNKSIFIGKKDWKLELL